MKKSRKADHCLTFFEISTVHEVEQKEHLNFKHKRHHSKAWSLHTTIFHPMTMDMKVKKKFKQVIWRTNLCPCIVIVTQGSIFKKWNCSHLQINDPGEHLKDTSQSLVMNVNHAWNWPYILDGKHAHKRLLKVGWIDRLITWSIIRLNNPAEKEQGFKIATNDGE